jgi:hypothetical protein
MLKELSQASRNFVDKFVDVIPRHKEFIEKNCAAGAAGPKAIMTA